MDTPTEKQLSVLYAEDDAEIRELTARFMRNGGFHVTEAADGESALALFRPELFEIVVTDFSMPSMNGQALAESIKSMSPRQLVVMLTGSPEALTWAGNQPQWIDLLLSKPITENALNLALRTLVPNRG